MGVKFFKKNVFDISNTRPTYTVTDAIATNTGEAFFHLVRNRRDTDGWMTTGSTDAANTTIVIDLNDSREFNRVLVLNHNLKAFTIKYWTGALWASFSTPIAETNCSSTSSYYEFDMIETERIQIIITGAQTVDADKYIRQLIFTESLGEFLDTQPMITPVQDKTRKTTKYLSGKGHVTKAVGAFQCSFDQQAVLSDRDLTVIELLYSQYEGFLVWLCGGTQTQYKFQRKSYRLEDIYFCDFTNEYTPKYNKGTYNNGIDVSLKIVEVN